MITSPSYKTDIPAFYGEWFMARLGAGYCRMVNPYGGQVYRVPLGADAVDGFVSWIRHQGPFLGLSSRGSEPWAALHHPAEDHRISARPRFLDDRAPPRH